MVEFRVGCQSWAYDDWVTKAGGETVFYPRGTKHGEMLELYSEIFDTLEVDSTLYGAPASSTFERWYSQTPASFTFSLKTPREITHDLSLAPRSLPAFTEFLDRASALQEKLAVILIQLPARFERDAMNLSNFNKFIDVLPDGFDFAVEFRDPAWFTEDILETLSRRSVALTLVEGKWVSRDLMFRAIRSLDTRLAYVRFFGERDLPTFDRVYRTRDADLEIWRAELTRLKADTVFVYFDNYYEGHAPATANKFKRMLGRPVADPDALEVQGSLF